MFINLQEAADFEKESEVSKKSKQSNGKEAAKGEILIIG
jgi:hypothetical protein